MTSCFDLEDEGSNGQKESSRVADKTLTVLEALPACMGWGQVFCLPDKVHHHVVAALRCLKLYGDKVKDVGGSTESPIQCVSCNTAVTFTNDDLLLGSKPHNRSLFVTGYIREQKVRHILINGGSAINIMPKSIINDLGITVEELSKSGTMVQSFNLEG